MSIGSLRGVEQKLTIQSAMVLAMLIAGCLCVSVVGQQTPTPAPGTAEQTLPPAASATQSEAPGSAPLRVLVGKSLLINTNGNRIKRISVTDSAVADAIPISPTQILIHGKSAGEVSLLIWDEAERSRSFDLRVDVDVTAATEEIQRVFPDERITVTPSRSAIVLSGHVGTEDTAKRAGMIAEAYSKNVVNVLTFGPVGAQEVLLEVKFAEVDRSALSQIGFNILSTGAGNTIGTISTGQFGSTQINQLPQSTTTPVNATLGDLLNMFLFRPDIKLGVVIKALQQKNLLQILAEPNLIAMNGKEASFLAGGEFPFPVVQPSAGATSVSIQFKQFGVQLKFTPIITPAGNIHLKVAPEVSTLDFANGVTVSGVIIPALSSRRAETEFELQDGQSFVIAGLMDNRVTNIASKIPGLGDIPILGNFFRSKSYQKSNAELMVLCTVHRVGASTATPPVPTGPAPLLDKDKFDKTQPGGDKK